jgi:hypothetical protein
MIHLTSLMVTIFYPLMRMKDLDDWRDYLKGLNPLHHEDRAVLGFAFRTKSPSPFHFVTLPFDKKEPQSLYRPLCKRAENCPEPICSSRVYVSLCINKCDCPGIFFSHCLKKLPCKKEVIKSPILFFVFFLP